jgi:hypothetical protein
MTKAYNATYLSAFKYISNEFEMVGDYYIRGGKKLSRDDMKVLVKVIHSMISEHDILINVDLFINYLKE